MRPNNSVTKFVRVTDAAGAAVTTLVTGDCTFTSMFRPTGGAVTTWTHGSAIGTHIGNGWYPWTYVTPPSKGLWALDLTLNDATRAYRFGSVDDETENNDFDSIYANTTSLTGVISTSGVLGNQVTFQFIPYRWRQIAVVVRDSAGAVAPLDTYANWRFAVRDKAQTVCKWQGSNGQPYGFTISGDISGNFAMTRPECMMGPLGNLWVTLGVYTLGDFVFPTTNNGWIYQVTTAGIGAAGEPVWPTSEGGTIVSGTVTFTARKRQIWTASTAKVVGEVIRPTADRLVSVAPAPRCLRCVQAGTTNSAEPTWPAITSVGNRVTDGTVIWENMQDPDALLATGVASYEAVHEVVADTVGNTAETVPVIRSSPLQYTWRQEGT